MKITGFKITFFLQISMIIEDIERYSCDICIFLDILSVYS